MLPIVARLKGLYADKRVRWATVVAALAILMLALGALALGPGTDDDKLTPIVLSDYDRALDSLKSGDATSAVELLQAHLGAEPDDAVAADLLDRLQEQTGAASVASTDGGNGSTTGEATGDNGEDPGENGDDPGDTAADPEESWDSEVADITRLLPLVVQGLAPGSVVSDQNADAILTFDPIGGSYPTVNRVLYAVHDLKTADNAALYIEQTSRVLYADDGEDVEIDGASGYFGTNSATLATVAYARGRYVFEIIVTASSAPEELRFPAAEMAAAFPDSPE